MIFILNVEQNTGKKHNIPLDIKFQITREKKWLLVELLNTNLSYAVYNFSQEQEESHGMTLPQ